MKCFLKKYWLIVFLPLTVFSQTVTSEEFALTTPKGVIQGTLTTPAFSKKKPPLMLLIAGSGPTDRNCNAPGLKTDAYKKLAEALAGKRVATLRFDKRGIAASASAGGREEDMSFETYIQDAVAWVDTLRRTRRFGKITIAGHSEGSLIGMIATRLAGADRFISIAGAGRNITDVLKTQLASLPDTMRQEAYANLDKLRNGEKVEKPNPLLYSLFRPSVQPYMISWMRYTPVEEISKLKVPVCIIQGKRDIQVAMPEAEALRQVTPKAKWVVFEEMNHILKDAPSDRAGNLATYTKVELPLTEGIVEVIAEFVRAK